MGRSFPDFLASIFDVEDLTKLESSVAVVDAAGAFLWLNPAWQKVADESGAGDHWTSYFDGIAPPLDVFYRDAFAKALMTGEVFEQEYECSTPDQRRFFHMRALPIDGRALVIEHSLVTEQPHDEEAHEALAANYVGDGGTIAQCSNCRRVRHRSGHAWHRVPRWTAQPHPRMSHVICPSCVGFYWERKRRRR